MGLFGNSRTEQKIEELSKQNQQLLQALLKVREDAFKDSSNLQAWIRWLYYDNKRLQRANEEFSKRLSFVMAKLEQANLQKNRGLLQLSKEQIKAIIDSYYSFDAILAKIKNLEEKIEQLALLKAKVDLLESSAFKNTQPNTQPTMSDELFKNQKKSISMLKEQLLKKLVRNSKDYCKSAILSLVKKYGKLTALQLRDIVVEEQGLCSRSSFYRLLEELEKEGTLGTLSQGRQKVFFAKAASQTTL
ncbi:MAG: hypothetical protein QXU88_02810 [Candidatus Woesearchaeota archaeon]